MSVVLCPASLLQPNETVKYLCGRRGTSWKLRFPAGKCMRENCQIIPNSIVEQRSNKPIWPACVCKVPTFRFHSHSWYNHNWPTYLCDNEGRALDRRCQFRSRKIFRCKYYVLPIIRLVTSPKFCIIIVSNFSLVLSFQEKLKKMLMQTKRIMGNGELCCFCLFVLLNKL